MSSAPSPALPPSPPPTVPPPPATGPPPTYEVSSRPVSHPAFRHAFAHLGLPSGFFLLRNVAQGKALDLLGHKQHEGAQFGLHPVKKPQVKGLSLQHSGNNQLFYLSWDGHLMAAAASRPLEVVDEQLSLAIPHPIMEIPSSLSHPLPRFHLDPETSTLHVVFASDPLHRGPNAPPDWQDDDYILEAVPRRRKPAEPPLWANKALTDLGSKAGDVFSGIGSGLGDKFSQLGLFGGRSAPASPNPNRARDDELPLPPPPLPDKTALASPPPAPAPAAATSPPLVSSATHSDAPEDDSDSDSEPSAFRALRVVRLPPHWRDKYPADALRSAPSSSLGETRWGSSTKELRRWRRRMWEVVPVTVQPVPAREDYLGHSPVASRSGSDSESSSSGVEDADGEDEGIFPARRASSFPLGFNPFSSPSSPPLARAEPTTLSTTAAPLLSTLHTAASTAQSHASSAATALGGMISGAFAPRVTAAAGQEGESEGGGGKGEASPPLPELPEGEAEFGGGDAAELESEEIDGLGAETGTEPETEGEAEGVVEREVKAEEVEKVPEAEEGKAEEVLQKGEEEKVAAQVGV
ncbi:hypothetical protein JCM10207_008462 [Rhodosporidiobolus poonsookiae]